MGNSVKISIALVCLIIAIIVTGTTLKVNKEHEDKLILVSESRIEYAARSCYLDEVCTGNAVNIGFLIEKKYLDPEVHPITKEYISNNLMVECKDYICNVDI